MRVASLHAGNLSRFSRNIPGYQLISSTRRTSRVLHSPRPQPTRARARAPLTVWANELNKWGDTDGRDEDAGLPENGFDRDTAAVVLRVLTARAAQRVLGQLSEFDVFVAQWLNDFISEHPPTEGNQFLLKLFSQPGKSVKDPHTQQVHAIDPQQLAHRILQVRGDMAAGVVRAFPEFVSHENTHVMRSHLEANSYTCGHSDRSARRSGYRRGYNRPRDY